MKPVIFYIDDEPHNLTVFEASMSDEWEVYTFDNPMEALKKMSQVTPWVIVSDQRMPNVTGVEFLELSIKMHPNAVRIIVTGYSDENLVVESVRKAKIFDYIRKPWDTDDLVQSIQRSIDFYRVNEESRLLQEELKKRESELQSKNIELLKLTQGLETSHKIEQQLREELECWVPPFVLWALKEKNIKFPIKKDIVGITFDIVDSSKIHGVMVRGKSLRALIIQLFSETIIKYGGWRESHSGDSAYGHFGLFNENNNPCDSALAVAREFRVGLRSLCSVHGVQAECGIALHVARECVVDVHTVQLSTPEGIIKQKSFDTTSSEIDLLHRMEKLVHKLPGSNIVMSKQFFELLGDKTSQVLNIGNHTFAGQSKPVELCLITSDRVDTTKILELLNSNGLEDSKKKAA